MKEIVAPPIAFSLVAGFAGATGMFDLVQRSGTLDGSLPLRAVQFCPPVAEGSAVGAQVMAKDRFELRRTKRGLDVRLSATGRRLMAETHGLLTLALDRGLLARGSAWHRRFADGPIVLMNERLQIWTGLLVRPHEGSWLVVTGAYNRRSRVEVVPHVIASECPVPVVLDIDLEPLARGTGVAELDAEVGCLLPVRPGMRMELRSLERELDAARSVVEFFDRSYFVEKRKKPTAKYRSLVAKARVSGRSQAPMSRLVYLGPRIHSVRRFARFAGSRGFSREPETPGRLEYGIVRSAGAIDATWDGQCFTTRPSDGLQRQLERFERFLRQHLPDTDSRSAGSFGLVPRARRDEPYVLFTPVVFGVTPPGWSSVLDGVHHPPVDGMRGVIATDVFHSLPMVFRSYEPCEVHWPARAPILRMLPVARDMITATWDVRPWTDPARETSS